MKKVTTVKNKKTIKTGGTVVIVPKPKSQVKFISRNKALDLIQDSKGRFFTASFITKQGTLRIMNAQYIDITRLGYILVKDANLCKKSPGDCTRNINLQTLKGLKIGGVNYKVR